MQKILRQAAGWRANVGPIERLASALGGGLLAAFGLRRGLSGMPLTLIGGALVLRGATGRSAAYKALGINTAGIEPVQVAHCLTISADQDALYRIWRNFANLPHFMPHLERVHILDERRSRWAARAPGNTTVEWEAELTEDHEPELIAWRAVPGQAQIWNAGRVEFRPAPGGRGTELSVSMEYVPPAGRVGQLAAKIAGAEPSIQILDSLRRLKMLVEAGEIATGAMRRDQDWEQGKQPWDQASQPWRRHGRDEEPEQWREVGR